jgi:hypothetical protein
MGEALTFFGLTYSAASHTVTEIKKKMRSNNKLKTLFGRLDKQYEL